MNDLRQTAQQPEPIGTAGDLFTNAALVQFDLRPSTKVYITHPPAPQPEPVAYYNFQTHKMRWAKPTTYDQFVSVDVPELPLYTHPPQRQPLTDEQMREVLRQCPYDTNEVLRVRWLYAKDFARAIEKAHGIEGDK